MAKLQLKDLTKSYSSQITSVKNINLTVEDNEFLTLLGPSGCGKSTILRMIAGLETPTKGQILLAGEDINLKSPGSRNIAMVFQSYALYPHLTVFENLASGLKLRKIPHGEIYRRVKKVSESLELEELLLRKPAQLSGGERQRVALGRALVRNAKVYLLDEPLSNLDATLREKVRADIKQIFTQETSPVVYVTHDQTEAMTLSSKVAVINYGSIQQLDLPAVIYKQPANLFVAGFVGSPQMNLLPLSCNSNYAILGNNKLFLPNMNKIPPKIVLGIRPEDIYIAQSGDEHTISGKIYLVENLGMHNLVTLHIDNHHPIPLTIRILLPTNQTWENQQITINLPPKNLLWFDYQSGNRL